MRPQASVLMGTVYRGEYVVDPLAVAEAILERAIRRRRSRMLEAAEALSERSIRAYEGETAADPDLS
jgi:hypothetical protein